ncbi:MAG: Gfo/Idh/MocA family oxidoreductase [Intrasporangiaceae bacterium]|nr:Gfo/Idh/MocA family oxidoreductase [Intrasporangiaceae bacterium]
MPRPDRGAQFAARHGTARVETSLEALASADDVDVVYIASPNALHHRQAALMLEGGKHVLVEKAAAANTGEFADLLDRAQRHDLVIVESIRSLFDPSHDAIESLLPSLGPIRRVRFSYCQRSRRYDRFLAGEPVNIFDPAMAAGALMDIGTYCVNPLVAWFGTPESIQAAAFLLDNGIDGAGTIVGTYPGMIAEVSYSKVTDSDAPSEIQGEDATLSIDVIHDPRRLRLVHSDGRAEEVVLDKPLPQQVYVLRAMESFIADPERAASFAARSLAALRLMDTVRAQTGIRFPSDP